MVLVQMAWLHYVSNRCWDAPRKANAKCPCQCPLLTLRFTSETHEPGICPLKLLLKMSRVCKLANGTVKQGLLCLPCTGWLR